MNRQRCSSQCIEDWGLETAVADVGDTKSNCGYGAVRRTPSRNQNSRRGSRQSSPSGGKSPLFFVGGVFLGGLLVVGALVLLVVGFVAYSKYQFQATLNRIDEEYAVPKGEGTDETIGESTIPRSQAEPWSPYERDRFDPLFSISNLRVNNGAVDVDYSRKYAGDANVTMVLRTAANDVARADMGHSYFMEPSGTFRVTNSPMALGGLSFHQGVEVYLTCNGCKVSNSLTQGAGMSVSCAIHVPTAEEVAAKKAAEEAEEKRRIDALIASRVMPPGYVKVAEKTSLVVGTQVKVGELNMWLAGEIVAVRGNVVDLHIHGQTRAKGKNSVPRSDLILSTETETLLTANPESLPSEICRYDVGEMWHPPVGYAVLRNQGKADFLRVDVPIMWERDRDWCRGEIVGIENERMVQIKLDDESELRRVNLFELAIDSDLRSHLMARPNDPIPETARPPEGFVYIENSMPLVPGAQVMLSSFGRWQPGEVVSVKGDAVVIHKHGSAKYLEREFSRSKLVISNEALTQLTSSPDSIVSEIAHTERNQHGWFDYHDQLPAGFTQIRNDAEIPEGFPVKVIIENKLQDASFLRYDGTHMALVRLIGFDDPRRVNRADIALRLSELFRNRSGGPNGAMPTRPGFGTAGFELPADHVRVADDLPLEPGMYVQLQTPNGWVRATVRKVEGDTISIDPDIPGAKRTDVSRKLLSVSERMEQLLRKR